MQELKLEGTFRLAYNGGIFAMEGLGYLLTLENLIHTGNETGLVFRPLKPPLKSLLYVAWKKYHVFTPMAERFLKKLQAFCITQSNEVEKSCHTM